MCDQANNDNCELVYGLQLNIDVIREEHAEIIERKNKEIDRLQERIIMLEMEGLEF